MRRRLLVLLTTVSLLAMSVPVGAADDRFTDDDASVHEADIDAIATAGITLGCNPPANDRFCPERAITRAEMATFLVRALRLEGVDIPGDAPDAFGDDDGSVHEEAIDVLAALGITQGCRASGGSGATSPVVVPDGPSPGPQLVDVRLGSTNAVDRLVFEFDGPVPGYEIRYVDLPVIADPSGEPVELAGDRAIGVRLAFASGVDLDGDRTYTGPQRFTPRFDRMAEVVATGDFERVLNWAIGVNGTPGFTVTVLEEPHRLVIDLGAGSAPSFCPDDPVTRGQMAAFLVRSFDYPGAPPLADWFADDNTSVFEAEIEALAMAGVTNGCNPPFNDRFCPVDPVTRAQMASFLVRALGL
jgi:hypothetical protein